MTSSRPTTRRSRGITTCWVGGSGRLACVSVRRPWSRACAFYTSYTSTRRTLFGRYAFTEAKPTATGPSALIGCPTPARSVSRDTRRQHPDSHLAPTTTIRRRRAVLFVHNARAVPMTTRTKSRETSRPCGVSVEFSKTIDFFHDPDDRRGEKTNSIFLYLIRISHGGTAD